MTTAGPPVYVVDDDASVRESLASVIRSAGWNVESFASAHEFLTSRWASVPSCLVLDLELPDLSGLEVQERLARANALFSIIFLTGRGDIPTSVRAMKAGALEFLTKPPPEDQLLDAIRQGLDTIARRRAAQAPGHDVPGYDASGGGTGIIGQSGRIRAVMDQIDAVATRPTTVLIVGETGTGKELVARAIHERSPRRSRPFVSVNCAAIPESLIASDLFGHEKGAFTGALQRRVGRFEQAQGGTIFLDEIGELPAETQVALLRVLQEKEFERLGGQQAISADVRVIAATNRDLPAAIERGVFRSDLFYRLNVFPIETPPLRSRKEDIPLLVDHFIERHGGGTSPIRGLDPHSLELLQAYSWPGNIRELQNVVERAMIVCKSPQLSIDERWLPQRTHPSDASAETLSEALARQEKAMIEAALAMTGGRVSGPAGAAARLSMPPSTMDSKIKALKIDKHRFVASRSARDGTR
jgi:DNA-binding NtrC family response regulator